MCWGYLADSSRLCLCPLTHFYSCQITDSRESEGEARYCAQPWYTLAAHLFSSCLGESVLVALNKCGFDWKGSRSYFANKTYVNNCRIWNFISLSIFIFNNYFIIWSILCYIVAKVLNSEKMNIDYPVEYSLVCVLYISKWQIFRKLF